MRKTPTENMKKVEKVNGKSNNLVKTMKKLTTTLLPAGVIAVSALAGTAEYTTTESGKKFIEGLEDGKIKKLGQKTSELTIKFNDRIAENYKNTFGNEQEKDDNTKTITFEQNEQEKDDNTKTMTFEQNEDLTIEKTESTDVSEQTTNDEVKLENKVNSKTPEQKDSIKTNANRENALAYNAPETSEYDDWDTSDESETDLKEAQQRVAKGKSENTEKRNKIAFKDAEGKELDNKIAFKDAANTEKRNKIAFKDAEGKELDNKIAFKDALNTEKRERNAKTRERVESKRAKIARLEGKKGE